MNNNEIILYQAGNQSVHIEVRLENETVWLTQAQIAELFGVKRPAITKHHYETGLCEECSDVADLNNKRETNL